MAFLLPLAVSPLSTSCLPKVTLPALYVQGMKLSLGMLGELSITELHAQPTLYHECRNPPSSTRGQCRRWVEDCEYFLARFHLSYWLTPAETALIIQQSFLFLCPVLGIEPRAWFMIGKCSITELTSPSIAKFSFGKKVSQEWAGLVIFGNVY